MIFIIFRLILLISLNFNLTISFVSFFSGPFMFMYSILRTIDGMTENIEHISNSMDLSLQSFLSKHMIKDDNKGLFESFFLNADYHGSIYPSEMFFHPTLLNCRYNSEFYSIIGNGSYEFENFNKNYTDFYLFQGLNDSLISENKLYLNNFLKLNSEFLQEKENYLQISNLDFKSNNNYIEEIDPYYINTIMVRSEIPETLKTVQINEMFYKSFIENPVYNENMINLHAQSLLRSGNFKQVDYSKDVFFKDLEENQISDYRSSNVNEFRLYTYYTTHYLFQITNIFTMGLSLHSQYRRKSRKRKLHLVR